MQKILFRSDSSSDIGLGHVMRDLVLAKRFHNAHIDFACQKLCGDINHQVLEAGYRVHILNSNSTKELITLIKKLAIDLLIIDNYQLAYKEEKEIKQETGVKLFVLDDTYKKHHCDILLNHNISADIKKYKGLVPSSCQLQCGAKYTLLRDEFYAQKKKLKQAGNKQVKTIFIAIGGTDHSDINLDILKVINKFKNIRVTLVTSSSNKNLQKLQNYTKNKKEIKLHIDTKKMAKLMRKSDFAIITPSVILNEVYFINLPFIAIKTAKNQEEIYSFLKKKRYLTLKKFHSKKLALKIKQLLKSL